MRWLLIRLLMSWGVLTDVGVTVVVTDHARNKTGLASNLSKLFPDSDPLALMADTLETAVLITKGRLK